MAANSRSLNSEKERGRPELVWSPLIGLLLALRFELLFLFFPAVRWIEELNNLRAVSSDDSATFTTPVIEHPQLPITETEVARIREVVRVIKDLTFSQLVELAPQVFVFEEARLVGSLNVEKSEEREVGRLNKRIACLPVEQELAPVSGKTSEQKSLEATTNFDRPAPILRQTFPLAALDVAIQKAYREPKTDNGKLDSNPEKREQNYHAVCAFLELHATSPPSICWI